MNDIPCLALNNLNFKFNERVIFEDLSFHVPNNSVSALIGLNGSGKTTLIKILSGLLSPNSGSIKLFSEEMTPSLLKRNVTSLIEEASVYDHLTAYENLNLVRIMYDQPKSSILEILKDVGLIEFKDKKVATFSLGMRQRLGLAMAILPSPLLLILDEPMNGLDPIGILEFREVIRNLNTSKGMTILFSTHLLNEAQLMATHVSMLHQGKIISENLLLKKDSTFLANKIIQLRKNYFDSKTVKTLIANTSYKILNINTDTLEISVPLETTLKEVLDATAEINWESASFKKIDFEESFINLINKERND